MTPYFVDETSGIEIYVGDARELADSLAFDVILTDPPYGTGQKSMYRPYHDTMENWAALIGWLCSRPEPTVFTIGHPRLFDLPRRPQWIGIWDHMYSSGIVHVGASPTWEPICFYNLPAGDRGRPRWDDIFRVPSFGHPYTNGREFDHPCPKPTALFTQLLGVLPDGVVLDPFCGTGATLRAAKDLGRRAIGIELSEHYCELAARRLAQEVMVLR